MDVVNVSKPIVVATGSDLRRIAAGLLDILGLDSRQIDLMCNRLVSDARARQQAAKGGGQRFWRNEVSKWTNVKIVAQRLLKERIEQAIEDAAVAAANEGKEIK